VTGAPALAYAGTARRSIGNPGAVRGRRRGLARSSLVAGFKAAARTWSNGA
jgi:hypothetical protein